jgi:anaerobic dimethyl sulfoxide reductase subunit C (anchor subunit)
MIGKEWALVGFTLLSQMAIGAFWIVWLTHFISRQQASEVEVKKLCNAALIGTGPVMAIALLVSFFHLGSPLNAWRAISNLGTSWLSREIFFALVFFVMWCVCAVMQWRSVGSEGLRGTWAALTALAGLATIISSAMAYLLPARPAWFDLATPTFFFASTFLLGALVAGAVFAVYYLRVGKSSETQTALIKAALKNISLIAMVVIAIQALTLVFQAASLSGGTVQARSSGQLLLGTYGVWYWLRVIVGIVAGFGLVWLGWRALGKADKLLPAQAPNLVLAAFICVLVGEVVGRALFYFTVVQVNLPGVLN